MVPQNKGIYMVPQSEKSIIWPLRWNLSIWPVELLYGPSSKKLLYGPSSGGYSPTGSIGEAAVALDVRVIDAAEFLPGCGFPPA